MIGELEKQLDSFDEAVRHKALEQLAEQIVSDVVAAPDAGELINLHCHTFYSYNAYGYSPSRFAWLAKKSGLAIAGVVDFDVLDGLSEFLQAARLLNIKGIVGMETRVFIPEFADRVINSPGEPGISYHMGVGFPTTKLQDPQLKFLEQLKKTAQQRNKELLERVNNHLNPLKLNYETDVLPLTPAANATERHICLAYAKKAAQIYGDTDQLAEFWSDKLAVNAKELDLPDGAKLQGTIRSKTMKRGGVGYVQPDSGSFPTISTANEFILKSGAIPTLTWLNGLSDGEQAIEELLDVTIASGVQAINIIPDRNYTPGQGQADEKCRKLYEIVEIARQRNLPIVVGTEMNSPGTKFVDSFQSDELKPLLGDFMKGAYIVYAHSVMTQQNGLGYTSEWANQNFTDTAEKNIFFAQIGQSMQPGRETSLGNIKDDDSPDKILELVKS